MNVRIGVAIAVLLLAFTACAQGDKPAARSSPKPGELSRTVTGTAENAKAGAVVVTDQFGTVYVKGLDAWPDDLLGQSVEVTGVLKREKLIPDPVTKESGEVTAGAYGDQTVMQDATWKRAD